MVDNLRQMDKQLQMSLNAHSIGGLHETPFAYAAEPQKISRYHHTHQIIGGVGFHPRSKPDVIQSAPRPSAEISLARRQREGVVLSKSHGTISCHPGCWRQPYYSKGLVGTPLHCPVSGSRHV